MIIIKSYTFTIIHVLKRRHLIDVSGRAAAYEPCNFICSSEKTNVCHSIENSFVVLH